MPVRLCVCVFVAVALAVVVAVACGLRPAAVARGCWFVVAVRHPEATSGS